MTRIIRTPEQVLERKRNYEKLLDACLDTIDSSFDGTTAIAVDADSYSDEVVADVIKTLAENSWHVKREGNRLLIGHTADSPPPVLKDDEPTTVLDDLLGLAGDYIRDLRKKARDYFGVETPKDSNPVHLSGTASSPYDATGETSESRPAPTAGDQPGASPQKGQEPMSVTGEIVGVVQDHIAALEAQAQASSSRAQTAKANQSGANQTVESEAKVTGSPDDTEILFYRVEDDYGCFSNFSAHPLEIDGKTYATSEHYFQSQKFAGTEYEAAVCLAESPMEAARIGRLRNLPLRPDWDNVKDGIMRRAVLAKFQQHPDIRKVLLDTGNARLVEHTANDRYWADGGNGTGKNMLGIILVEVRGILAKEAAQ